MVRDTPKHTRLRRRQRNKPEAEIGIYRDLGDQDREAIVVGNVLGVSGEDFGNLVGFFRGAQHPTAEDAGAGDTGDQAVESAATNAAQDTARDDAPETTEEVSTPEIGDAAAPDIPCSKDG